MKFLFSCILVVYFSLGYAQLNSRSFSYDFGDIQESNGEVSYGFQIENFGIDTIEIIDVESSCGCTSFFLGEKKIGPKSYKVLKVNYNPKGRPGRFHKSIRIKYQYQYLAYEAMFTVRGNVLRNQSDAEESKIMDLRIQPFNVLPVSEFDTSFTFLSGLEEFINGITYEIDLHGFAVLGVDHISYTISNKGRMDGLISKLKRRIALGLRERGYQDYQVTYRKTDFDFNFIPDWAMSRISLYSVKYTSKDVYYYEVHREVKENNKDYRHLFWKREYFSDTFDIESLINDFSTLLELKLKIRDSLSIELSFAISFKLNSIRKKFERKLNKRVNEIKKMYPDLKLVLPEVIASTENLVTFKAFEILEEKPMRNIKYVVKESKIIPPMLPMAHYSYNDKNDRVIDTSDVDMKRILSNAIIHIKHNKKIQFNIESSVSHLPKKDGQNPLFHGRQNARHARDIIESFMKNRGVDQSMYEFVQLPMVQGPNYSLKYSKSFYKRFEYLNVIPTFQNVDTGPIQQTKYMVNFNSNSFTIDSTAAMFKVFMRGIIDEINQLGYAKIILESSSSKAPTRTKENLTNDVISYKRAAETRDIMKNYLYRAGIDPNRLILVEERCLVQGPEYALDYFENKEKYKQFQYIKIIPKSLLSE